MGHYTPLFDVYVTTQTLSKIDDGYNKKPYYQEY